MSIKIAMCGTHGSGKTTLANALAGKLENATNIGSIARSCPLPISDNTTLESQLWIMCERIKRELQEQELVDPKYIICERSIIDDFAYSLHLLDKGQMIHPDDIEMSIVGNKTYLLEETKTYEKMFETLTKTWAQTYDKVFYLHPLPYVADGVRPDTDSQKAIDGYIFGILDRLKIPYIKVPAATIEERVAIVYRELKLI